MPSRNLEREQFWRLVLEEHEKSGLNAREFCRRESISEPSFYAWRRKIRDRDSAAESPPVELLPVNVVETKRPIIDAADGQIEVVVANDLVVRLREGCSSEAIVRVLSAAQFVTKSSVPC